MHRDNLVYLSEGQIKPAWPIDRPQIHVIFYLSVGQVVFTNFTLEYYRLSSIFNRKWILLILLCIMGHWGMGQEGNLIQNGSFEIGSAHIGKLESDIPYWYDCGFKGETAPDVHDNESSFYGVEHFAAEGKQYVGLVVRDNLNFESLSSELVKPMLKGHAYQLTVALAKSDKYASVSRVTNKPANYNQPAVLRIYGGSERCDRKVFLAESKLIALSEWINYSFILEPDQVFEALTFEAYYHAPLLPEYNGNILLDNIVLVETTEPDSLRKLDPRWASFLKIQELLVQEAGRATANRSDTSLIRIYQQKFPQLVELKALADFSDHMSKDDLIVFVQSISDEEVEVLKRSLERVGAENTSRKWTEASRLIRSASFNEGTLPEEDRAFLDEFIRVVKQGEVQEQCFQYVNINQDQILDALLSLRKEMGLKDK